MCTVASYIFCEFVSPDKNQRIKLQDINWEVEILSKITPKETKKKHVRAQEQQVRDIHNIHVL